MARMNKSQLMNKIIEVTNATTVALSKDVTEELAYMVNLHQDHPKEVQPSDVKALIENLAKEGVYVTGNPSKPAPSTETKKSTTKAPATPTPAGAKKSKPKKSTPAKKEDETVAEVKETPKKPLKTKKDSSKPATSTETKKAPAKKDAPKKATNKGVTVATTEEMPDGVAVLDKESFDKLADNKVLKFKDYIFPQAFESDLGLLERRDNIKSIQEANELMEKGTDLVVLCYWTDQHIVECNYDPYKINKKLPKSFKGDFDVCQIIFSSDKVMYGVSLETEVISTFPANSFKHKKGTNYRIVNGMEFELYEVVR